MRSDGKVINDDDHESIMCGQSYPSISKLEIHIVVRTKMAEKTILLNPCFLFASSESSVWYADTYKTMDVVNIPVYWFS